MEYVLPPLFPLSPLRGAREAVRYHMELAFNVIDGHIELLNLEGVVGDATSDHRRRQLRRFGTVHLYRC